MVPQIVYTHSNCKDIWDMFFEENAKHTRLPLHAISDKKPRMNEDSFYFEYKDSDPYWEVWSDAVKQVGCEYFIYLQEDFVLYDDVDEYSIMRYISFLKENKDYSFVRLLRATSFKRSWVGYALYDIESDNKNVFAMQPTIWRASDYIDLMRGARAENWLECAAYRNWIMSQGMKGAYHYSGEPLVGKHHYASSVYPYIATAFIKGKWNLGEYNKELSPLLQQYNIDPNVRGYTT